MATLGVLARVESDDRQDTVEALNRLEGVSTFSVEDAHKLGLLIEQPSLKSAHQLLTEQIEKTPGVLCAWPVYTNLEDEYES